MFPIRHTNEASLSHKSGRKDSEKAQPSHMTFLLFIFDIGDEDIDTTTISQCAATTTEMYHSRYEFSIWWINSEIAEFKFVSHPLLM